MVRIAAQRDGAAFVFVVDDSDTNRRMIEILLKSEGYAVCSAETGQEALRKIRQRAPDLLLLDLALPDMHGSEVLAQLAREGFDLPVLVVTGDTRPASRTASLHVSEFLTKPYDIDALVAAVTRLIASASE